MKKKRIFAITVYDRIYFSYILGNTILRKDNNEFAPNTLLIFKLQLFFMRFSFTTVAPRRFLIIITELKVNL